MTQMGHILDFSEHFNETNKDVNKTFFVKNENDGKTGSSWCN